MKTRFNRALDALYSAFFDQTLAKGNCTACAVGNICKEVGEKLGLDNNLWSSLFLTCSSLDNTEITRYKAGEDNILFNSMLGIYNSKSPTNMEKKPKALKLVAETGYTVEELSQIEYVFESNTKIFYTNYPRHSEQEILEDQYNGLKAVVEVMMKLDNIEGTQYVSKFREHPKLQVTV